MRRLNKPPTLAHGVSDEPGGKRLLKPVDLMQAKLPRRRAVERGGMKRKEIAGHLAWKVRKKERG